MRTSFVITNHDYARYLGEAIRSCLAQHHDDVEIVVVDDGSTDDSRAVIESFGSAIVPVFQDNRGQAAAFNAGFAVATGAVVCLLDADDIAEPQRAARAAAVLAEHPDAGWLFHQLTPVDADGRPLSSPGRTSGPAVVDWRPHAASGQLNRHLPLPLPATSGMCLRADLVARLAPLPVRRGILINDNYLKYASLASRPGVMIPDELGRQRLHGTNLLTAASDRGARLAAVDATTALELLRHELCPPRFTDNLAAQALLLLALSDATDDDATAALDAYLAECGGRRRRRIRVRSALLRLRARLRREPPPSSLPPGVGRC